jgi:hypothetical protein
MTFDGATGYISLPTSGLPTGNAPWSLECWCKPTNATNAANGCPVTIGNPGTNGAAGFIAQAAAGGWLVGSWGGSGHDFGPFGSSTAGAIYHIVGTYDGSTLRLYVNGALAGSGTPGTLALSASHASIGDAWNGSAQSLFFNGTIDEVAIYPTALSATQVTNHYNAGHSGATGTAANATQLASGGIVRFGSPVWGAINAWQVRLRWAAGLTAVLYLHRIDANNSLYAYLTGSSLMLYQLAGGVVHQLNTTAVTMTRGAWYWLTATQFPTVPGDPAYVQATLAYDSAGAPGASMATTAAATYDTATALAGQPALYASGASLALGGPYANVHTVSLFGPGGWLAVPSSASATGMSSAAWDTATAYPGGPVGSVAAARVDLAPAGTVDTHFYLSPGGASVAQTGIPVPVTPATFGLSAWYLTTSGLSAAASVRINVVEYDAGGNTLRTGTAASATGPQTAWTQLAGTYTTGASTAYLDVQLRVADTSAPGASANATVWLDNVQCWNQTATGATSMPYCELRFPQSPAQLLVSGLLGDLPAPAALALGSYLANWPKGGTLSFAVGRRGAASATARLAAASVGYYGTALSPTSVCALDATSYGGYFISAPAGAGWNPRFLSLTEADAPGIYHLIGRFLTAQAQANLANVTVRAIVEQRLQAWFGDVVCFTDQIGDYYGAYLTPITASNAWTVVDAGQVTLPAFNRGRLADPTQLYATPHMQWADATPGGSTCQMSWQALLPVDGALLAGVLNNPANAPFAVTSRWLWAYFDGLGTPAGLPVAWTYSLETAAQPNAAHAGGGPGTQGTGSVNVNSGADPYLTLDPQVQLNGSGAVNQLLAYLADGSAAVLPFYAEITYSPLYLYPR